VSSLPSAKRSDWRAVERCEERTRWKISREKAMRRTVRRVGGREEEESIGRSEGKKRERERGEEGKRRDCDVKEERTSALQSV
jgi:hypothetical protein